MGECMTHPRHFLDLREIDADALKHMLATAAQLKRERANGSFSTALANRKLCMVFEKNSTRTRVSFEVGMLELGGQVLSFSNSELQLGRGESIADTARVLSRYVDCLMLRCYAHATLTEMAEYATIPVINGLTDVSHPCQVMADILTFEERKGSIQGKTIAWIGDGNNMAHSWIEAAAKFDFILSLACPEELRPSPAVLHWAKEQGAAVELSIDPVMTAQGADAVITDTWVSMGDTDADYRMRLLTPYQVNADLMQRAKPDAIFLHCLPAHRGEEVTADVLDGSQSAVWDEAENRLHAQKAILLWCMGKI